MKCSRAHWLRHFATLALFGPRLLAAPPVPKVQLISGEEEYGSLVTLPAFARHLDVSGTFRSEFIRMPVTGPAPALSGNPDLLVIFIRRRSPGPEFLAALRRHLDAGRPLVALRTSSHAFEDWKSFDEEILGCHYEGHHGNQLHPEVTPQSSHPLTRDLQGSFPTLSSLYKVRPLAGDTEVFWTAGFPSGEREPVGWTRILPSGARVAHITLGHPADFTQDAFITVLNRACLWAVDRAFSGRQFRGLDDFPVTEVDTVTFDKLARHHRTLALDVRTRKEYAEGHVPGSLLFDLSSDDFAHKARELDPLRPVVVYCRSGVRAARAAKRLQESGLRFISVYPGSMQAWLREGRPVEKAP